MMIDVRRRSSRKIFSVAVLTLVIGASTFPANALDTVVKGHKATERHVFRDVQRGIRHPAPHGKSTQTTPEQPNVFFTLFPWLFAPSAVAPSQGNGAAK